MPFKPAPIEFAEVDFDGGTPVSRRHQDAYFMRARGLDESRCVFIDGSRLTERFARLGASDQFVIGETGFGSGLNCLLAAELFSRQALSSARLTLISVERYPLRRRDLETVLDQWPQLEPWSKRLIGAYPPPVAGYHRVTLAPNVELILMLGDGEQQWSRARAAVDAWFLDGFAPDRNPDMWSPALIRALAERSRPGTTIATFTAAGSVRRALADAGFEVRREAGFGGKRHRITACRSGTWTPVAMTRGHAVVAGAGLAGATSARALATRGWTVTVCDPTGIAKGASGNRAGLLYSTPSAHPSPQNRFYQLALLRSLEWLGRLAFPITSEDGRLGEVLQIPPNARARLKQDRALSSGTWPEELLIRDELGARLRTAGYLRPARWCEHLLDHPAIHRIDRAVSGFRSGTGIVARLEDGQVLSADSVILGVAAAATGFPGLAWLPLKVIRGQVTFVAATAQSRDWTEAICHAGYLTPAVEGSHCVGATFDLHSRDAATRPDDDKRNLEQLREHLPGHWQALGGESARLTGSWVGQRCQSPDFLPLAGPLPDPTCIPHQIDEGVVLNLAHGSRGITHTPLCADLIADQLSALPPSVDPDIVEALAPERFILRWRRRQADWQPESS